MRRTLSESYRWDITMLLEELRSTIELVVGVVCL